MFTLTKLLRENIKNAKPYSSARDEYKGNEGIFLDANENPIGSATERNFNRYPDPLQLKVKEKLARLKNVAVNQIFLGNGSDEAIDLLYRAVGTPGIDNAITLPPTYGMYEVSAAINDIKVKEVPLTEDFQVNASDVLKAIDEHSKLLFICSPNNPTGNLIKREAIVELLTTFEGIVIIDEAYVDFSSEKSFIDELSYFPNLVILQTFSKAWGLAGLRLGVAYASAEIISVLNKIKPPYNINQVTQELALEAMDNLEKKETMVTEVLAQRTFLIQELSSLKFIEKIYPSDANFILIKTQEGKNLYTYLISNKIITRDRSKVLLCAGCVRITVGTAEENKRLLEALLNY